MDTQMDEWMEGEFLCLFNWFIAFPKECSLKVIFSPLFFVKSLDYEVLSVALYF